MTFDPGPVIEGIDTLRALWIEAQPNLCGHSDASMGFVNIRLDDAGLPTHHIGGMWETLSNHEALTKGAWALRMKEIVTTIDDCLHLIPALDFPELDWHIAFHRDQDLPSYRMLINRERMTSGFVKTSTATARRLSEVAETLYGLNTPSPGHLYSLDHVTYRADTPLDAAIIRSALRGLPLSQSRPKHLSRADAEGNHPLDPDTFDISS